LVLNMISTSCMIQLGRVEDNKMVNMQLTNDKLVDRGVKMDNDPFVTRSKTFANMECKKALNYRFNSFFTESSIL
jgi:N-acetylmuramic acid 6-phosphate (MurNAc-6-P) etherase